MRLEEVIAYLLILAGIAIAITGVLEQGSMWIAGGVVLAALGAVLVQSGRRRRRRDHDCCDVADALFDSLDD